MAKDYLAIPATSVSSEQVFSSAENMITDKRCRLAPKTVRAGQCLRSWMKRPLKGKLELMSYRLEIIKNLLQFLKYISTL